MSNFFDIFKSQDDNTKSNADKALIVKTERCPQNHACPSVRICPIGALQQNGYSAPTVDKGKCIKCGKCVSFCLKRALVLE